MSAHKAIRTVVGCVAVLATLSLGIGAADAAQVDNGSFETGDFTDWASEAQPTSAGDWFVYTGNLSPLNDNPVPTPACGTYAAVSDTEENSANVLYQDIALEADQTHSLSLQYFYVNYAPGGFITPDEIAIGPANQQFRIDIVDPAANPFSATPTDVLDAAFRTDVGDPQDSGGWQALEVNLSAWAGQTVRLRFAFTSSANILNAGADCVEVTSTPIPTTTTTIATTTTVAAQPLQEQPTFTG